MTTRITLPYPPSANVYWRHNRGRIHRSQEAEEYIKQVGLLCMVEHLQPLETHVYLSMDFYRPARRGDLDNLLKVTIDALRGYAYVDDSQITELHAMRYEDKADPRVVVFVKELP